MRAPDGHAAAESRRAQRARRKAAAPFFFGKQAALFFVLMMAVLVLDFFLFIGYTIYESNGFYPDENSPNTLAREAGQSLEATEDGYALDDGIARRLADAGAWAILVAESGEVIWSLNAPDEIMRTYTLSDTAVAAHYGYWDDDPFFIWQRDDGLFVVGFPRGSFYPFPIRYLDVDMYLSIPAFLLTLFVADALAFFGVYMVAKRRVVKGSIPLVDALDDLAKGRPAHVRTTGSMREVGESINAASAAMRRKDEARKAWVSGVSHDIRTPLSISMAHAERIAADENAPDASREAARAILRQSARIRDLVSDLNIASKLEYDMQPLDARPMALAPVARSVAADYLNDGLDERFALEADVAEDAEGVRVLADERLVRRALRNLVDNSVRHNEGGCRIVVSLRAREDALVLSVQDDGVGIPSAALARLNREAAEVADGGREDEPRANGPVPPPGYVSPDTKRTPSASAHAAGSMAARNEHAPNAAKADIDAETASADESAPSLARTELSGFNDHGLGLSLVARIVAAHGGSVEFSGGSNQGFGTTMAFPRP